MPASAAGVPGDLRAGALHRGDHHDPLPAPAAAGDSRLPAGGAADRSAHGVSACRRSRHDGDAGATRGDPAALCDRARVLDPAIDAGGQQCRDHGRDRPLADGVAGHRGRLAAGMDRQRGAVHRCDRGDLEHDDHRQGVRGDLRRPQTARAGGRCADRRRPGGRALSRRPGHARARRDCRCDVVAADHGGDAGGAAPSLADRRAVRDPPGDAPGGQDDAARDDRDCQRRAVLCLCPAGRRLRLFGRSRGVPRRIDDQRVGSGRACCRTRSAGARRLWRGVLRGCRHADRAVDWCGSIVARCWRSCWS